MPPNWRDMDEHTNNGAAGSDKHRRPDSCEYEVIHRDGDPPRPVRILSPGARFGIWVLLVRVDPSACVLFPATGGAVVASVPYFERALFFPPATRPLLRHTSSAQWKLPACLSRETRYLGCHSKFWYKMCIIERCRARY